MRENIKFMLKNFLISLLPLSLHILSEKTLELFYFEYCKKVSIDDFEHFFWKKTLNAK